MTDRGALRIDKAGSDEAALLADLNRQLDEDEPHPYPLPLPALVERMARWIDGGEYEVLLFRHGDQLIGYAVWRADEHGTYLRHFFICRDVFPKDRPVNIDAAIGNKAGIAFWRAIGFQDFSVGMELKAGEAPK